MAKTYGTLQLLDELATIDKDNVFHYGEDLLYSQLSDVLVAHNAMTKDLTATLVAPTTDEIRRFGAGTVSGEMVEVDEFGSADVQKTSVSGYDIGFPLRDYEYAMGWTRKYFDTHTVADLAKEFVAAQAADVRNIKRRILMALFRATNYNFIDRLTNSRTLPIKALHNADGTAIPPDPFGTTFDGSTHTHLVGRAGGSLAAADITALINNVVEHGVDGGEVVLYLNKAQVAAVTAFSSNFEAFQAPLLTPGGGSTADIVSSGRKATPYTIDDKPIGVWNGYVMVWQKPWMPANYIMAYLVGGNSDYGSVLEFRTRPIPGYGEFRLVADHEHFPLRAQAMEREFGIGVWNRLGAAILYIGGTSYVQPTISF